MSDADDHTATPATSTATGREATQSGTETDAPATDADRTLGEGDQEEPLAEAVADLQDRVAALEAERAALAETVAAMETEVERNSDELREAFQTLTPIRKLLIGEGHDAPALVVMKELRDRHGPVNQQLADLTRRLDQQADDRTEEIEQKVGLLRAEQNAKLRQLAAATDVEIDAGAGDVITRIRTDGIEAVCATPRKRDRRAAHVLQHIEEWGTKEQLRDGPAYRVPRPRVKRLLNATDAVTVTMTSKTVGDVFDAIETLAAPSPRFVQRRKHDGVDNLYVGFPATEGE